MLAGLHTTRGASTPTQHSKTLHGGVGAVQLGVGNPTFASLKTNNTTDANAAHPVIATAVIRRNLRIFILLKQ